MRAYHVDLRERIVAAVAAGAGITAVARQFGVHRSTIYRYRAQQKATGSLVPRPIPGRPAVLIPADETRLVAQLAQHPTATLAAHCAQWTTTTGVPVSQTTMSRAIKRLGWTRKKGQWQPASATTPCGLPGGPRR